MINYNMMSRFLLFVLLFASSSRIVAGEIDLLAEPEVLTLEYGFNPVDQLKETEYDLLHYDLLSGVDLDENVGDDVMLSVGDEGDITDDPDLVTVLDDDGTTIVAAGEGPVAVAAGEGHPGEGFPVEGEAAGGGDVTTPTEADVPSARITDPRLEKFAERLELLTLSPEDRKLRKIEFQLQKISVQNTEEEEKKIDERKQKIIERREKKAQEKLEKKKDKNERFAKKGKDKKVKISENKKDSKKNAINILPEEINSNVENNNNFRKNHLNNKELDKENISDKKKKMREERKIVNIEKRKARYLRKGKERNLRILQHMIHREETGVPFIDERKSRSRKPKKENVNRIKYRRMKDNIKKGKKLKERQIKRKEENGIPFKDKSKNGNRQLEKVNANRMKYRRMKRNIRKWKNMKERRIKRRKEIHFLLRLKRGFGARLDTEHKKEVSQQLRKLKLKYKKDKNKFINFQKDNWELIEENKLISNSNILKKKINFLQNKSKQYINATNSNYLKKLSKRINYYQNKHKEIRRGILALEKFHTKLIKSEENNKNQTSSQYNTKIEKLKSKIKSLNKMKKQIDNEKYPKHILKLKENIKNLFKKYKELRKKKKISNETKKERKTRKLKEKIKSLKKIWKEGVDTNTQPKISKTINNLMERYKKMHNIIRYEKKNKCYLREDLDSINFLKMQHLKAEIKLLKDKRKQIGNVGDHKHRAELRNTIKILLKEYKKYKQLERVRNETKTERKNRKLREQISSLMKMRKESKEVNVKTKLSKRIKNMIKSYKKTRKIIKYENKFECRYFSKLQSLKDKSKLLLAKKNQINSDTDSKFEIRLTKRIRKMIKSYEKFRKLEIIRNESENGRKFRELKEKIKSVSKLHRNTVDLDRKKKIALRRKNLRKRYQNIYLIVRQEAKNIEQIKRSYEKRQISKYYLRMEKLKLNIKALIGKKRQMGKAIDPKIKLKLAKRIKKLVNMYRKYERLEKILIETNREKKHRKIKEKIKSLNKKKNESTDSNDKARLSKIINDLMERYKKIHNFVKYEKKNKCYLRYDYNSHNSLKMEKLKENIKLLMSKQKALGPKGDLEHKTKLKEKIKSLIEKYRKYKINEKNKKETENEQKKRNLKETIKSLVNTRKESKDQNIQTSLSKRITALVKRYKKMGKIIKYENIYECRYFRRVQKLKERINTLKIEKRQINGDNVSQQKDVLDKRIKRLIKSNKKYNSMEKIRKETENGRMMRKLTEEIKSLVILRKNTSDLNVKKEISGKITVLKNRYINIRLIVKYEEKDMEIISKSYESRIPSKTDLRMQKLKSKIISLMQEKKQYTNKVYPEHKLKLLRRITNLIRKYKKYKILENKSKKAKDEIKDRKTNDKKNRKNPQNKRLERRRRALRQRRKYKSCKHIYKLKEVAKRKRKQRKLQLRKRRVKREKMATRRHKDVARNWQRTCSEQNGCGIRPVIPEGMAYCKPSQSNPGGGCQCWYLQHQM